MKSLKVLRLGIVVKLLLVSLALSVCNGCASTQRVVVYPIQNEDMFEAPVGSLLIIPEDTKVFDDKGKTIYTYPKEEKHTILKQGWVLSDFYVKEVMKAIVEKK
jgi:hypothetical protein